MARKQRLDKILGHMGYGTRSELKKLIKSGFVTVNGKQVKDSGWNADPVRDEIIFNGERVRYRQYVYIMMNKPPGVVSATEDARERTVIGLLREDHAAFHPFPAGRLDKDTEGLLLLTNDGALAHNLLSPKKHVPKTYYAEVEGEVTEADAHAFAKGVALDDGVLTQPAALQIWHSGPRSQIELTITEGKFHQVKRMFEAVGKKVLYLKRLSMGSLTLDPALSPGQSRELTEEELQALREETEGFRFAE